jgi:hypothetical protein
MRKALPLAVLGLLVGATLLSGVASAGSQSQGKRHKVDICHLKGDGTTYRLITVGKKAKKAHLRHGDARPGDTVEGGTLDEDCNLVPEPQRFESGPLSFGPNGFGGWSCPPGMTAVGGGHTLTSVADEGLAVPGGEEIGGFTYPTYPHHTFAAGETGFVVQNDNDSETGTVFVDCVPTT